jgi:signal transduction histidine kinase
MNIEDLKSELDQIKDEKYNLLKLVNHDIRSPFNRVFALLQLFEMESEQPTERQKEYMDSMYLSILSGLEMITNLRDMREIDAGNVETDISEFDLEGVIQKSVRSFSKQTEIKHQKIMTHCDLELAPIQSDEYIVQRIMENVLSNAVKFSKANKDIHITLSKDDKSYFVEVQDAGDGIRENEEYLLFKKFRKLSNVSSGGAWLDN